MLLHVLTSWVLLSSTGLDIEDLSDFLLDIWLLIREYNICSVPSNAQDYPSSRKPLREFHCQAIEGRFPVVNRHGPLLGHIAYGQVDHLVDRFIRGKMR